MESPTAITVLAHLQSNPNSSRPVRHYRQKIRGCTYVKLNSVDGGLLRDLSEFGIAMHSVGTFVPEQKVQLRFELENPRVRVESTGRVVWTDALGRSGIEFLDLPPRVRCSLQEWLLTQILAGCENNSSYELTGEKTGDAAGLLLSASVRPAIRLELPTSRPPEIAVCEPDQQEAEPQRVRLLWCPFAVSAKTLASLLDGLVLLCGLLLFAVMAMIMTSQVPSWPLAIGLAIAAGTLLVALYWLLFRFCMKTSPGQHLTQIAFSGSAARQFEAEQPARFR